ncbi:glycoside hydrolase family 43 protein [Streptomyces tsukubensis]|uniref:Glycoside hydrolase 43 family protein n=1 Tax=Streptomyces tsukubensis TaxID=83656 RepID=A0A1V4A2W0_9ACTN|nr:glycoside hydrolase family 43 protein [Streptomyces tsukubensis]OON73884.1 glycoside hydrolase 43 family protein [Streptomyces tsukubensis]QFR91797.1 family 43 glycosylhydrolase [Streptomyces tsukubensis]
MTTGATSPADLHTPEPAHRATISNPVLTGFHPDPSILRVGDDYYLATSTFEWSPGVRVHHSRDLVHWRPLRGALDERRLLDLSGVPDSGGVWAPCLSYAHGLFHLVFTRVDNHHGGWWDAQNYVVTASDIEGPWSDPAPVHARGFDPSLFHDEDGTCWMLSMTGDWRPGRHPFAGIQAQRWECAAGRPTGGSSVIFTGTEAGVTEAPHLYRRDGWYYLMTAEGGTSYDHQVTVARSRTLAGPYEVDPAGPTLTSRNHPELTLQKAGHGSLVETREGQWYLAHLTGRPQHPRGRCVLGRETALQQVEWTHDGWPRVPGGLPAVEVPAPRLPAHPFPEEPARDDFDSGRLGPHWATLRRPATPDWVDLSSRRSHLRVHGGQSPLGPRSPSLVARRAGSAHCSLETSVDFRPKDIRQLAGLTAYYDTRHWHYAYVSRDDAGRTVLSLLSSDDGRRVPQPDADVVVPTGAPVDLRLTLEGAEVHFEYRLGTGRWSALGPRLDATILSDEYAGEKHAPDGRAASPAFTGAFLGLWVQDIGADGAHADFDHATYQEY